MTELEPIARPPEISSSESIGELLTRFMWVHQIEYGWWNGSGICVSGMIKPDVGAKDPTALRQSFLSSFEAILRLLREVGIKHARHPDFQIAGKACHYVDGAERFEDIEASLELHLYAAALP